MRSGGYVSPMTSSLPQDVREAFERYITCELTTIDSRRQPITWPVTPYYSQGGATLDVTTGIGYPKKANDARRNPHVALLFSDPTGSGVESGLRVLVQGTADIDDRDLEANRERYWRESWEKLPGTRKLHPPGWLRGLFNWYYTRIYVKVRPERVFVWPDGDPATTPTILDCHLEEVRSGHIEEPVEPAPAAAGGAPKWDERLEELGRRHETAVLSWVAPDGFPLAVRLPVSVDRASRRVRLEGEPASLPIGEGRACLAAHRHSPSFEWQENFQVRGDLVRDERGWSLLPRRFVGGFELPEEGSLEAIRRNFGKSARFYRTARRYRRERSL
jgi:hypothetical protein